MKLDIQCIKLYIARAHIKSHLSKAVFSFHSSLSIPFNHSVSDSTRE